ncbi:MAG: hypothetical protein R3F59_38580 [Myxococcota bacterium]
MALWAGRRVAPERIAAAATEAVRMADAPAEVRVRGAHALPDAPSAVEAALRAPSIEVRYAAASAMPRVVLQADLKPRDPAVVARAVLGQGCPRAPSARRSARRCCPRRCVRRGRATPEQATLAPLVALARGGGSEQERLDAIGALSLSAAPEIHEVLGELAFAEGESEAICKAAFRARRRVARAMEARA